MIRVPDEFRIEHLLTSLQRGLVIRLKVDVELDDPNRQDRYKYIVVLNGTLPQDNVVFVFTTSNAAAFLSGRWESDILRIPKGTYEFFSSDTIINCREAKTIELNKLKDYYCKCLLTIEGSLSVGDVQTLDKIVRASRLISLKLKKEILPECAPATAPKLET